MRIIDADALKETIVTNVYPVTDYFNSRDYGMFWTGGIEKAIDEQPTIEPERKKGKWIEHNPHKWGLGIKYECSECGYEVDCEEPNFCPNCGCSMKGEP